MIIYNHTISRDNSDVIKLWDEYPEVTGSSSLGSIGGFIHLVTPKLRGINQGTRKLIRTSTVIKIKNK